jgi:hypothetical protein
MSDQLVSAQFVRSKKDTLRHWALGKQVTDPSHGVEERAPRFYLWTVRLITLRQMSDWHTAMAHVHIEGTNWQLSGMLPDGEPLSEVIVVMPALKTLAR